MSYLPGSYLGCSWFIDGDEGRWFKHWADDAALLFARTLCDDQAFLPIILGALLSAVPRSLDDRWLRRNGLAYCIATECGYAVGVGANTHSDLMTSNSVPQIEGFCFAQTNSSTSSNGDTRFDGMIRSVDTGQIVSK